MPEGEIFVNESSLEMLKMMFPNHSDDLIKYVLVKRLGEDEQAIAYILLDEEIVANYLKEMEGAKTRPKQLSEFLVSSTHIFETLFSVLGLCQDDLSCLIWKIIANLPSNLHYINAIKNTILKSHDWN